MYQDQTGADDSYALSPIAGCGCPMCSSQDRTPEFTDVTGATDWGPARSADQIASQLTDGYWEATGRDRRTFDLDQDPTITVDLSGLSVPVQDVARAALDTWTTFTGITFLEVTDGAQITMDDNRPGAYASLQVAGDDILTAHINVSQSWTDSYGLALDSYSYQTFLHEMGHALGLGHAGNYNGSADFGTSNLFANDSWQMSVMSYFSQTANPTIGASFAWVLTPMPADIAAIQALYRQQGDLRQGDTVYGYGSTAGGIYNDLADVSGAVAFTILDDGGRDRFDGSGEQNGQRINLNPGAASDVFGLKGNMLIADGTWIEAARGGAGSDVLIGNVLNNRLIGRDGNDRLEGDDGADRLRGNAGQDLLLGGSGNDVLRGGRDADDLQGGGGADVLRGGRGADVLTGGAGADEFVFSTKSGSDVVTDFDLGEDEINLLGHSRRWDGAELRQDGADALVVVGTQEIRFIGVAAEDLQADVFSFA